MDRRYGARSDVPRPCRSNGSSAGSRRLVRSARGFGFYDAASVEFRRLRRGGDHRFAMIYRLVEPAVSTGCLNMLSLYPGRRDMSLARGRRLLWSRTSRDAADTSVVTHVVHSHVVDDNRLVVDVRDIRHSVH